MSSGRSSGSIVVPPPIADGRHHSRSMLQINLIRSVPDRRKRDLRDVRSYVQRIREDFRDYIGFKYANEGTNIMMLLLDPTIEDRVGQHMDSCRMGEDELE